MTLSDLDLETRLRDLGARADAIPPAPFDLADRVRARHRTLRRREIGLGAAALAVVLLVVGVPILSSSLSADPDRGHVATPSTFSPAPTLAELPTRGSLAKDAAWVRGVQRLSWRSDRFGAPADFVATLPDPAVEDRTVAFAGDVPGGRVALVLSRDSRPAYAWFTGPTGAEPGEMTLATLPSETSPGTTMSLATSMGSASAGVTLVVIGRPGDEVDRLASRSVDAAGDTAEHWAPVPMRDGVGAAAVGKLSPMNPGPELRVTRDGRPAQPFQPDLTVVDIGSGPGDGPVSVADPRGLSSGVVDEQDLQSAVEQLAGYYVARPEELHPTLLAAGPVDGDPRASAVLVGVTFPSGAVAACLVTTSSGSSEDGGGWYSVVRTEPAPAGAPLLDRLFAVQTEKSVTVSGPAGGVRADVYGWNGTLRGQIPLRAGTGSGAVTGLLPGSTVRIIGADGAILADSPLTATSN